jgi:membrane-bound lytic murein transglycosylase F
MAFAETLGNDVKPKFLRVEWDEQFFNKDGVVVLENSYTPELLASGKCDFYPNTLVILPWRLNKLDFVTLYPTRYLVIVNKSKQAEFKAAADLAGKVAAILKEGAYQTWLQEQNESVYAANPIQIELVTTEDEGLKAVDEGKIDFTIVMAETAIWSTRHQFKNSVGAFAVGPMYEVGWAFRKEDKDLQAVVQKFFDTQRAAENSSLNQIWDKYFDMSLIDFIGLITKIE